MGEEQLVTDGVVFRFGPYTLDTRTRRLRRNETTIPLTTKAFDTLEHLVRDGGKTVAKDELLKRVWPDTFVQDETLAQNISTIRRALGDNPDSARYVLTLPREGYRFVAPIELVPQRLEASDASENSSNDESTHRPDVSPIWGLRYLAVGLVCGALIAWISFTPWKSRGHETIGLARLSAKFEVLEPTGSAFSTSGGMLAISPDGERLAFLASGPDDRYYLWIRILDSLEPTVIEGTADATQPFWSPDGQSIAFFSGGFLKTVSLPDHVVHTICELPVPSALSGSWSREGVILFGSGPRGLFRVNASGGSAQPLTFPGMRPCTGCLWPSFLPDGHHFLFTRVVAPDRGIYVASVDGTDNPRLILENVSSAVFVQPGFLLFASAGALVAQAFDLSRGIVNGDPIRVADQVWTNLGTARAVFSASQNGVLAYQEPVRTRLEWISRSGFVLSTSPEAVYHSFAVSPSSPW